MKKPKRTILNADLDYYYDSYSIRKKSGKLRKIIAPSSNLKRYSRHAMHKLLWHFKDQATKSNVLHNFHGFIPHRNSVTAATMHIGFDTTIMFDFSNFFDTVKLHMFDEYLFESLDLDETYLFHKQKYAAQGFPSSPMLANIASIDFMRDTKLMLSRKFGIEGKDFAITIYADDIQISFNHTDIDVWRDIRDSLTQLATDYDFQINPRKTRVRFAKYGFRKILGVNVGDTEVRATRRTMRKLRAMDHNRKRDGGRLHQVYAGIKTWSKCLYPKIRE